MSTEPRYTLAEAKAELARQECVNHGHTYGVLDDRTLGSAPGQPVEVYCSQCETTWPIHRPTFNDANRYDRGGHLPHGATSAVNTTGNDEPVHQPEGDQP